MSKRKSLQPWLDYFDMLHTYEQKGYLEVKPEKHEAYITRAALCTLSPTTAIPEGEGVAIDTRVLDTARRLRTYAAYRSAYRTASDADYDKYAFALHIVKEEPPHDVLCTLLLTRKRNWLGIKRERVEVINYS